PFLYWRSRWWLFKEMVRILFPYYDVSFPDFWIADQLNSLAIVLLDMQYFICYLVYGQNATT
uniref:EXS domain-containing protein n=1 Tax=Amphimedon queenslandica TaxID=400682 RepID=A0A1X7SGR3_AMPQE